MPAATVIKAADVKPGDASKRRGNCLNPERNTNISLSHADCSQLLAKLRAIRFQCFSRCLIELKCSFPRTDSPKSINSMRMESAGSGVDAVQVIVVGFDRLKRRHVLEGF